MPILVTPDDDAVYFSMSDVNDPWSRVREESFLLEGTVWPTIEHYYQAMKFLSESYREKIRQTKGVDKARKLGTTWFKKKRPDWKKVKTTIMTRAIYTRFKTYPESINALLETGDDLLVENSQYDYFWGCGRDRRGHNHYGKVLMNVREKLREEQEKPD